MVFYIDTYNEFDYYHSYLNESLHIVNKWINNSYCGSELLELFDYIQFMVLDSSKKYLTILI